jgi:polar amino acid transport system substrate-binding protein
MFRFPGRILLGAAFVTAFCMSIAGGANAESMADKAKNGTPIVIATEDDFRPFEYIQDGKPVGLDNALFDLLKSETKQPMQHQILPWTGLLAGVSSGKYDAAMTGALINKERMAAFDFTTRINDLSGKTVGVQAGSVLLARLPELQAMLNKTGGKLGKVVQYQSYPEAYQDLADGRIDYVVNTQINLMSLVHERADVFALGDKVSGPAYIGWPVRKGNEEMLDFLNAFIKRTSDSGQLAELQKKWLGVSFGKLPDHVSPTF